MLFLVGILILSELPEMKRLLRQIHDEMIQTRLASEESDKALVMIQTDTLAMKRLMEKSHDEMIQTRLASEESDKALVMIQTDTLAMKRLMEKQAEDPAARVFQDAGEPST